MQYANLENWTSMWKALGTRVDLSRVYEELVLKYSEPHRAYHTLQHIEDCLAELEKASSLASDKDVIALAIWYHDLVYNTEAKDNEERSADIALQTIRNLSLPNSLSQSVATLIVATTHFTNSSEPDTQLLCDIDLAILGQPDERFDEYERQIRQEYDWVPEGEFISRRGEILQSFLDRPTIYSTKFFREKYEEQARRNIRRITCPNGLYRKGGITVTTRHIATIGEFKISLLIQDWFALDGGFLFCGFAQDDWQKLPGIKWIKKYNIVPLPINVFLIQTPTKNILVDTSIGQVERWNERTRKQFRMKVPESMDAALARHDLAREDIDYVLHTHLHFDHAGGNVRIDESGVLVPTFPNAFYMAGSQEIDHAFSVHPKTRASYRRETVEGIELLKESGQLRLIAGESKIHRYTDIDLEVGITLIPTPGHTDNHYSVLVESEGKAAFIAGAMLTTRWHTHLALSLGNDTSPLKGADSKMKYLQRAYEEDWLVLMEHDELVFGHITKDENSNLVFE